MDKAKLIAALESNSLDKLTSFLQEEPELRFFQERLHLKLWNLSYPTEFINLPKILLDLAGSVGSKLAADYLVNFCNSTDIPGIEVLAIQGIKIDECIELSNGIKLIPYKDLPDSYEKALYDITSVAESFDCLFLPREIQNMLKKEPQFLSSRRGEKTIKPTAALICSSLSTPKFLKSNSKGIISKNSLDYKTRYNDLLEVCALLTIVGPSSPTPIAFWWQPIVWVPLAHSSCLIKLEDDLMINQTNQSFESLELKKKAKQIHDAFLKLPPEDRKKLVIPLKHLNRAIRRKEPAAKANELGVSMDSLFLKKEEELTKKLKSRAAQILAKTTQDSKGIEKLFGILFDLRSSSMHDGIINKKYKNVELLLQQGIQKVAEAIEIIIKDGKWPVWEDLTKPRGLIFFKKIIKKLCIFKTRSIRIIPDQDLKR